MAWIGRKKLALVPLSRTNAHPPDQVPADWEDQILRRMLFDPTSGPGTDLSLRTYIHAASSGRADLDAVVMPRMTASQQDVPVGFLEAQIGAQLRAQGFDAAAIVMLGGPGAGTAQSGGFWARFVMVEGVGVWAMEFIHVLTSFQDLYPFNGNMAGFDEMACACGTHPSAFTKAAIGWIDASSIAQHAGHAASYDLHSIGLVQPPPAGRVAAVRIGALAPYLMVEARQRVDEFDRSIPSEGVIVYRVQTTDPLGHAQNGAPPVRLLTPTALTPGGAYTSFKGVHVRVTRELSGGFSISVTDPAESGVYTIQQKSNGRFMDAHEIEERDFGLVTRPAQNNDTQRWLITPLGDNTFTIQQKSNGRFVDAHEIAGKDFAVVSRPAQDNDTQRWVFKPLGNDTYTIRQMSSGRFMDAHEITEKDFALVTRPAQTNDTQRWVIKSIWRNPLRDTDLKELGVRYAAAWSSQRPASLAALYTEDGSLQVNEDAPAVGRTEITAKAQEFMSAFPDMVVQMDEVARVDDHFVFRWTWTGTNTGPAGSGRAVRITGYEEWTLDADGRIAESRGHFDQAEYQRQVGGE